MQLFHVVFIKVRNADTEQPYLSILQVYFAKQFGGVLQDLLRTMDIRRRCPASGDLREIGKLYLKCNGPALGRFCR